MQLTVKYLLVSCLLTSCAASEETRYRDTTKLELPPALQENRKVINDDSALPDKRIKKGLGTDVYMTTAEPHALRIKQSFDIAWNTLESALKQSEIEIKDRDLDKGLYYVTFDPDDYVPEDETVTGRVGSFFTNEYSQAVYVLTVTADGAETQINAAKANKSEQSGLSDNKPSDTQEDGDKRDGAAKLLRSLYQTLRDDWVEK